MTLSNGIKSLVAKKLQTLRGRLLAGSLVLVFVIWAIDRLSQTPGPGTAKAAQPSGGAAHLIPDPPDRLALENFLSGEVTIRSPLDTAGLRDPFAAILVAAHGKQDAPESLADLAAPATPIRIAESQPASKPFDQSHRLQGVVFGARPYAMIDGRSYRVGDRIDGYRISSIQRDHVILHGTPGTATLRMGRPHLEGDAGTP